MTEALWYLARATGLISLVLFTASLCLGVIARSGRAVPLLGRVGVADLHRTTALTAVGLVIVHVVTLLFDPYAGLRLIDIVVPGLGTYRPFWLALGTMAFDLLLVITVVSLMRNRVGPRVFHLVHLGIWAMWPIALMHGLGTGTDSAQPWAIGLVAGCVGAVAAALAWRLHGSYAGRGRRGVQREPAYASVLPGSVRSVRSALPSITTEEVR